MNFDTTHLAPLATLLSTPQKIVIVTHRNPDGDALGSSLGWKFFLEKKGHDVCFVSPNTISNNLKWIQGIETVVAYDSVSGKKTTSEKIEAATVIFCLDFNALSRLEDLGAVIQHAAGVKVMIDHHRQPEDFALLTFNDITYCSTAELVYDIISALGHENLVDAKIAECLYVGLVTDNGFFQFNSTTPNAHKVAAALVAKGAKPDYVSEKVNNNFRESRLRFFGYCLHEKLKLVKNGKVAYMMLSQAEIKKFNLQSGDSEGLVNYPFKIEGVMMSVYFSEEPDKVKISFRSREEVDVNTFARTYFSGGGHRNAAGGKSALSMDLTEKKFLETLSSIKF